VEQYPIKHTCNEQPKNKSRVFSPTIQVSEGMPENAHRILQQLEYQQLWEVKDQTKLKQNKREDCFRTVPEGYEGIQNKTL
jgi:hypothetical protein